MENTKITTNDVTSRDNSGVMSAKTQREIKAIDNNSIVREIIKIMNKCKSIDDCTYLECLDCAIGDALRE